MFHMELRVALRQEVQKEGMENYSALDGANLTRAVNFLLSYYKVQIGL